MKSLDADLMARLMSLPETKRMELLDFLSNVPSSSAHIERLITKSEQSGTKSFAALKPS